MKARRAVVVCIRAPLNRGRPSRENSIASPDGRCKDRMIRAQVEMGVAVRMAGAWKRWPATCPTAATIMI